MEVTNFQIEHRSLADLGNPLSKLKNRNRNYKKKHPKTNKQQKIPT